MLKNEYGQPTTFNAFGRKITKENEGLIGEVMLKAMGGKRKVDNSHSIPTKREIEQRRALVQREHMAGLTVSQIAKKTGIHRQTIHNDIELIGAQPAERTVVRQKAAERRKIIARSPYYMSLSVPSLASKLNVTVDAARADVVAIRRRPEFYLTDGE